MHTQTNAISRGLVRHASTSTRTPYRTPKPSLAQILNKPSTSQPSPASSEVSSSRTEPNTHYRITLHRSAIGLPGRVSRTLEALGLHKRMRTVFHEYSPDIAGKILQVKELVQVTTVPTSAVRSPRELREERKALRGYEVVDRRPNSNGHLTFAQAVHERRLESQQREKAQRLGTSMHV